MTYDNGPTLVIRGSDDGEPVTEPVVTIDTQREVDGYYALAVLLSRVPEDQRIVTADDVRTARADKVQVATVLDEGTWRLVVRR